ncbi:MAG: hypothetical protein K9M19_06485, partial [Candidatus Marinimicrobia bacterium]|nr:hypothetical protein [Candidatus Neomarinimicrobiota bacterium]
KPFSRAVHHLRYSKSNSVRYPDFKHDLLLHAVVLPALSGKGFNDGMKTQDASFLPFPSSILRLPSFIFGNLNLFEI